MESCDTAYAKLVFLRVTRSAFWNRHPSCICSYDATPNLHISLLRSDILPESDFLAQVNDLIQKSPRREAFVFVHGYNVSFEDAARRTGQIARDLKFQGAPILYSWPSRASLFSYSADEATVEVSAVRFAEFLRKLAQSAGASVLHIIAHSMGNRAVLLGLERLAREADPPKLNNVILTVLGY